MSNIIENDPNGLFEEEEQDTIKDLYLTFEIDNEDYAIDVFNVKEIVPVCTITLVPDVPHYLKGIINLRGDIIPVIDVRARFSKLEIPYNELTCIVVIEYEDYILGLLVDRVKGTLTITEENISPPPNAKLSYSNQFVKSVGKCEDGVKLLLNLDRLIFD